MRARGRGPAPRRRRASAAALCCAGLALAGCASGGNPQSDTERVTVTESVTPTPTATATTASSDVKGRRFDVGTVSDVTTVGGELVLRLDRWTVKGLSDAKLAKDGISITPHTGDRFTNQNDDRLRTVPVAPGATLVVNRCVKDGAQLGLTSTPQDAAGWLDDPDPKAVLLLTYDSAGRAVRLDTDPRC